MSLIFSKKMSPIVENSSERTSNFALGRKFYLRVSNNHPINYFLFIFILNLLNLSSLNIFLFLYGGMKCNLILKINIDIFLTILNNIFKYY